jgi:multicomponent Na+:H+ antiporter subunit D
MFGALAFCLLILSGYYPAELRAINLDTDWFYRKGGRLFYQTTSKLLNGLNAWFHTIVVEKLAAGCAKFAEKAPVILVVSVMELIISGKHADAVNRKQIMEKIKAYMVTASVPIGISAAAAVLFFIGLFFCM